MWNVTLILIIKECKWQQWKYYMWIATEWMKQILNAMEQIAYLALQIIHSFKLLNWNLLWMPLHSTLQLQVASACQWMLAAEPVNRLRHSFDCIVWSTWKWQEALINHLTLIKHCFTISSITIAAKSSSNSVIVSVTRATRVCTLVNPTLVKGNTPKADSRTSERNSTTGRLTWALDSTLGYVLRIVV